MSQSQSPNEFEWKWSSTDFEHACLQSKVTFHNAILHDFVHRGRVSSMAANNRAHSLRLFFHVGGSIKDEPKRRGKNSALILRPIKRTRTVFGNLFGASEMCRYTFRILTDVFQYVHVHDLAAIDPIESLRWRNPLEYRTRVSGVRTWT